MRRTDSSKARCASVFGGLAVLAAATAVAQQPAITPAVSIDQARIHEYPMRKILESGGDFHTTPFTPEDGHGEGQEGPRARQRQALYPNAWPNFPFLRVNGLDSQSCYECHNTIGSYVPPDYSTKALLRKPSPVGGSAGLASNAFINPNFPWQLTYLIRNPPHVFGTGYAQSVAGEMSTELALQREIITRAAIALAKAEHRSVTLSTPLRAKGLAFGVYATTCAENGQCSEDTSKVTGVASDLIVRPFQWKGIASSVRHFVRDALDFHLSMQAVEKVGHIDCDRDGMIDEMSLGNVTALTAFVAMTRPPYVVVPQDQPGRERFERGKAIFEGAAKDLDGKLAGSMCATCHVPSLTLQVPELVVEDPGVADVTSPAGCPSETLLINPEPPSRHAVTQQVKKRVEAILAQQSAGALKADAFESADVAAAVNTLLAQVPIPSLNSGDLRIGLTRPGDAPAYVYPRLPARNERAAVSVPLLSDLRTHNMGSGLQDVGVQGADVTGISIAPPLFLTRPLWGVADTGPWLHDGRARTLKEAIAFHSSPGSEANPVIAAFTQLSPSDQQAVVDFLLAHRLPVALDIRQGK
ncbi:di-heme oxidoreductase (putative peroxidase) [Tahibacter aquaticus]|uniref:Di-heme oxidoreductase (Putative peroxidase) n=1 Tax=Tahibacter aquaticus TaxID=520092 RepID=A0A4R6YH29_9GAMM|nr:di-heme oxidoredictase family protein [Tahibacter aquaticus]TDR35823.1 di-heme oxidoreductase (putative peroxidase) [Tahibacter aquaticus]